VLRSQYSLSNKTPKEKDGKGKALGGKGRKGEKEMTSILAASSYRFLEPSARKGGRKKVSKYSVPQNLGKEGKKRGGGKKGVANN